MKKVELQELIQDFLTGGDAPDDVKGQYHDEVILKHMENAFNAIVQMTWRESKMNSDYSVLDSWARNYEVTISDLSGNAGNVILPYPPMQLPDNMGILQVTPTDDLANPFAYLETNSQGVFAALEVSTVMLGPEFYLEQNPSSVDNVDTHRLVVSKVPDGVTEVKVKLIVPLSKVDLYDEVPIPAGKEVLIVQGVISLLRGKPIGDTVNDNLSNIRK